MIIIQNVSLMVKTEVPDHHTEVTGPVAANTTLLLVLTRELPGQQIGDCQIVEVDKIQNIHIDTLEVI